MPTQYNFICEETGDKKSIKARSKEEAEMMIKTPGYPCTKRWKYVSKTLFINGRELKEIT